MTTTAGSHWIAAAAVFGAIASALPGIAAEHERDIGALATPAGITLQPLGVAQGYEWNKLTASFLPRDQIAFASPTGMTLYIYAKDTAGKTTCTDECAVAWRPALAPRDVQMAPNWSTIPRPDGSWQWAYKGMALYTSARDVDPGSVYGNSPARFGMKRLDAAGQPVGAAGGRDKVKDVPLPAEWKVALAYPVTDMKLPVDITIKEVPEALGLVLVDYRGMTLYVRDGDSKMIPPVDESWAPAEAPQLSAPVGDFNFVVRDDGIKQWTYQGRGLYTYAGDLAPGYANGTDLDPAWHAATILRYYMPPGASLQETLARGKVLATADGKTLYRRESHIDQTGGGHNLRRGQPIRPAIGREIGITHVRCDKDCQKVWHPFKAPDDAKPWGQWTVMTRPNGTKQWAYQDYALWTYDGDKHPGDINGNDDSVYFFAGKPDLKADAVNPGFIDIGTPQDGGAGLYWAIAIP